MNKQIFVVVLYITFFTSFSTAQRRINNEISFQETLLKNVTKESAIELDRLHDQWIDDHPIQQFTSVFQYVKSVSQSPYNDINKESSSNPLLVIADLKLYDNDGARAKIDRYVDDIHHSHHGRYIILETVSGGTPQDIKAMIKGYYDRIGLDAVVFIGQIVPAWFEVENDCYWWEGGFGYSKWTCDLYYMDLNGNWIDSDNNDIFNTHMDGLGDRRPEIFVGRIDPSTMGYYGDEITLLCRYLDNNHAYWTGAISLPQTGLIYTDHDFVHADDGGLILLYGSPNVTYLQWSSHNSPVSPADYLVNQLGTDYGFLQLWTHADLYGHGFHAGNVYYYQVYAADPKPRGYNIIGCHAADWAAGNGQYFLCGAYIYNNSATSLTLTSTTKSGGMRWSN